MVISFANSSTLNYRSICFEGGNPASILKSKPFQDYLDCIKIYCKENGIPVETLQPVGYPEFLYKLHTSLNPLSTQ
jgi:hypothetical protein